LANFNSTTTAKPTTPTRTNRTHIPQSLNMASQSVQCFGKKKTATGTDSPPPDPHENEEEG
jgi:hypothetical protein